MTVFFTVLACALAIFLRRSDVVSNPQLWAEDGSIFMSEADTLGWRALLMTYGGYYHTLLRLIAVAVSWLDALWIPTAYLWVCYVITLVVIAALFSPRINLPHKPWIALAVVLVPHSGEVILNLTNLQWITAIGLILVLLAKDAQSTRQTICDVASTALLGLTGPFSLTFVPLFLLRAFLRRSRASTVLAAVAATTAAIQFLALLHFQIASAVQPFVLRQYLEIIVLRVWGVLVVGQSLAHRFPFYLSAIAGALLAGVLVWGEIRAREYRWERIVLWGALLSMIAAVSIKFRHEMAILGAVENGDRYFFLPKVLVLWIVLVQIAAAGKYFQRILIFAVALIFFVNLPDFHFEYYEDYNWPAYAAKISAGGETVVPLNPKGYVFVYPGKSAGNARSGR